MRTSIAFNFPPTCDGRFDQVAAASSGHGASRRHFGDPATTFREAALNFTQSAHHRSGTRVAPKIDMRHANVQAPDGCPPAVRGCRTRWRAVLLSVLIVLAAGRNGHAQLAAVAEAAASPALGQSPGDQRLALTGCASFPSATQITFYDEHHSLMYRWTERGLRLARRQSLQIVGGLWPTVIIAAQPDDLNKFVLATLRPTPAGSTPFAPPKRRTAWIPTPGTPCEKP